MAPGNHRRGNPYPMRSQTQSGTSHHKRHPQGQEAGNPDFDVDRMDPGSYPNREAVHKQEHQLRHVHVESKQDKRQGRLRRFLRFMRGKSGADLGDAEGDGETGREDRRNGVWSKRKGKDKAAQTSDSKQLGQDNRISDRYGVLDGPAINKEARDSHHSQPNSQLFPRTDFVPPATSKGGPGQKPPLPKGETRGLGSRDPLRQHPIPEEFAFDPAKLHSTADTGQVYELGEPGPSKFRQGAGSDPSHCKIGEEEGTGRDSPVTNLYGDKEDDSLFGGSYQEMEKERPAPLGDDSTRSPLEPPPADGCTFQEWQQQLTELNKPTVPNRVSSKLPWPSRSRLTMASSRRQKSICPSIASHTSWNPFNLPGPVRVSCFADVLEIIRQRRESNANLNGSIGSVLHRSSTNLLSNPNANAGVRQVLNRSSTNLLSGTAPGGSRRHTHHSSSNLLSIDNPLTTSKPTEAQPKIIRKPLPVVGTNPFLDRASSAAGSALHRTSTLGSTGSSRGAWSSDFQATTVTSYTDATNIASATSAATNDSTFPTRYKRATDATFDSAIDVEGEGDDSYRSEGLGLRTSGSSHNEHGRPRAPRGPARLAVETPRYEFMPDSGGESSSAEAWWKTTKAGKEELKNSQVGANVGGRSRGYAGKGKEVDRGAYHESRGHGRELSHEPVDKGKVVDRNEFQRFGDYDRRDSDSPTLGTTGKFRKGHRRGFEAGGTFGGEARYTFDRKGSDSFGEGD